MALPIRSIVAVDLIAGVATSLTTNGSQAAVDLAGYINPYLHEIGALLNCGNISGTSPTLVVVIQGNATTSAAGDAGWTPLYTYTTVTTNGGSSLVFFGPSNYRYFRANYTILGTSPTFAPSLQLLVVQRFP